MNEKILRRVKESAICSYEDAVSELLKADAQYQRLAELENEYEKRYEAMKAKLSEDTAELIDNLLSLRDQEAMLYSFWVYVVGVDVGAQFKELLKK